MRYSRLLRPEFIARSRPVDVIRGKAYSVQGRRVHLGLPYVKHQPVRQGHTTTPGTPALHCAISVSVAIL